MAYKLIWSPISRDDLREIVRFISLDSPQRAQAFALRLITRVEGLQQQPEIGRVVPEHRRQHIRELFSGPIALFIVSTMLIKAWRLRVFGTPRAAPRKSWKLDDLMVAPVLA